MTQKQSSLSRFRSGFAGKASRRPTSRWEARRRAHAVAGHDESGTASTMCGPLYFEGEESHSVAVAILESRRDGGGARTLQESRARRAARREAKQQAPIDTVQ